MAGSTVPIAPIPLARSRTRLLGAPLILVAAGVVAVAGGAVLGDMRGIGLVAAGLVVVALGCYLAVKLMSVRLEVEVATLRLRWLGGERRYTLVRGPVTRVALRGREAARLRPGFGAFGWGLGRARLRRSERIELVRLARTSTMILVPTDRGRVGVAPASEQHLLNALAAAARIQQRLDEVAERARAFVVPDAGARQAVEPQPAATDAETAGPPTGAGRRVLTGIERTLLEERLAADRAAALLAAEAERQAAMEAAADATRMAAFLPAETATPAPAPAARLRRRGRWQRPAWLPFGRATAAAAPAAAAAVTVEAPAGPAPEPVAVAAQVLRPAAVARPFPVPTDRLVAYGVAVFPALAAGIVWAAAAIGGRLELPAEQLRTMAVALLAVGPAGALAGLVACTWYPRLLGMVAITSLAALGLVGRALLG
jgi:hypothetical protein